MQPDTLSAALLASNDSARYWIPKRLDVGPFVGGVVVYLNGMSSLEGQGEEEEDGELLCLVMNFSCL